VSPAFRENATFKMETKKNLDCKLQTKEELFKEIMEEKENKINEIKSVLELMRSKMIALQDENYRYEEMINRYKHKLGKSGEYFSTEGSEEDSIL